MSAKQQTASAAAQPTGRRAAESRSRAAPPAATYGAILSKLADEATFPAVRRAIASGELDDEEEAFESDFEYGLARILDGIEALIARKR